jgi:hypothetical protein
VRPHTQSIAHGSIDVRDSPRIRLQRARRRALQPHVAGVAAIQIQPRIGRFKSASYRPPVGRGSVRSFEQGGRWLLGPADSRTVARSGASSVRGLPGAWDCRDPVIREGSSGAGCWRCCGDLGLEPVHDCAGLRGAGAVGLFRVHRLRLHLLCLGVKPRVGGRFSEGVARCRFRRSPGVGIRDRLAGHVGRRRHRRPRIQVLSVSSSERLSACLLTQQGARRHP